MATQISGWLKCEFPFDESLQLSDEFVDRGIGQCAQPGACTPQAVTQTGVRALSRMNLNASRLPDVLGMSLQALYDVPERLGAEPGGCFPIDRH
jgi:hypothetical protein